MTAIVPNVVFVTFREQNVRREGDYLHATDMWRACGSDPSRKPYEWFRQKGTRELLAAAERQMQEGAALSHPIRSDSAGGRGVGGNTWLHKRMAVAYATYLDPDFALFVYDVFLDAVEGRTAIVQAPPNDGELSATQIAIIETLADRIAGPIVGVLADVRGEVGVVRDKVGMLAKVQSEQAEQIRALRLSVEHRRRRVSDSSKHEHIDSVAQMGGRCPCCFTATIVIDGRAMGAEFDHFYAASQPDVEHTWLICRSCHSSLTRGIAQRTEREPMFKAYHSARRRLPGRQQFLAKVAV